jgi:hypothetical protein
MEWRGVQFPAGRRGAVGDFCQVISQSRANPDPEKPLEKNDWLKPTIGGFW